MSNQILLDDMGVVGTSPIELDEMIELDEPKEESEPGFIAKAIDISKEFTGGIADIAKSIEAEHRQRSKKADKVGFGLDLRIYTKEERARLKAKKDELGKSGLSKKEQKKEFKKLQKEIQVGMIQEQAQIGMESAKRVQEAMPQPELAGEAGFFEKAGRGILRSAPAMATTAISGPVGAVALFHTIRGNKLDELEQRKEQELKGIEDSWQIKEIKDKYNDQKNIDTATLNAILSTPVEYFGTVLELGFLGKMLKGSGVGSRLKSFLINMAKNSGTEGFEEWVQTHTELIADTFGMSPEKSGKEVWTDINDEFWTWKHQGKAGEAAALGVTGAAMLMGAPAGAVNIAQSAVEKAELSDLTSEQRGRLKANPLLTAEDIRQEGKVPADKARPGAEVRGKKPAGVFGALEEDVQVTEDSTAMGAGIGDRGVIILEEKLRTENERVEAVKIARAQAKAAKETEDREAAENQARMEREAQEKAAEEQRQAAMDAQEEFETFITGRSGLVSQSIQAVAALEKSSDPTFRKVAGPIRKAQQALATREESAKRLMTIQNDLRIELQRVPDPRSQALMMRLDEELEIEIARIDVLVAAKEKAAEAALPKAEAKKEPVKEDVGLRPSEPAKEAAAKPAVKIPSQKYEEYKPKVKEAAAAAKAASIAKTKAALEKAKIAKEIEVAKKAKLAKTKAAIAAEKKARGIRYEKVAGEIIPDTQIAGTKFGTILSRISKAQPVRKTLATMAKTQGKSFYVDVMHPGKIGARLYKANRDTGMPQAAAKAAVTEALKEYTPVYNQVAARYLKITSPAKAAPFKSEDAKRSEAATRAIRADVLESVAKAKLYLKGITGIEIVNRSIDLKQSNPVMFENMKRAGTHGMANALFDPDTKKIYVFTENASSSYKAKQAIWHEFGHFSLSELLGPDLDSVVRLTGTKYKSAVAAKMEAGYLDETLAAEEVLIDMFTRNETNTAVSKFKNLWDRFIQKIGFHKGEITEADVRNLVAKIRKRLILGKVKPSEVKRIKRMAKESIKTVSQPKYSKSELALKAQETRKKMARGALQEQTKEFDEAMAAEPRLQPHTIRHTQRFFVGKQKIYGPKKAGDKAKEVVKTHPIIGRVTYTEYRDKRGNLVLDTPILPVNKKAREDMMDKLIQENRQYSNWYVQWGKFLDKLNQSRMNTNEIAKRVKILGVLSAGRSPRSNQMHYAHVMTQLERGDKVTGGAGTKISTPEASKIMAIWTGKDADIKTLEDSIKLYGTKVGSFIHVGLHPYDPKGVVVDRHVARLWGFDVTRTQKKDPIQGYHGAFNVTESMKKMIDTDIIAAGKQNNMSPSQAQAAMWFAARPDLAQIGAYREAAQIQPSKYLPEKEYISTTEDRIKIIHWQEGEKKAIKPSPLLGRVHGYSKEVQKRKDARTPMTDYVGFSDWYAAGVRKEAVIAGKPHVTEVPYGKVYNLGEDKLKFWEAARARVKNDPDAHSGNTSYNINATAHLLREAGYMGFSTGRSTGTWFHLFQPARVEPQVTATLALSDVVDPVQNTPQDITAIDNILESSTKNLQLDLAASLKRNNYPIKIEHADPTVARFEDATSGQLENGLAVKVTGPLSAIRAFGADAVGLRKAQRMVFVMHSQAEPNGSKVGFAIDPKHTPKEVELKLKANKLTNFNLRKTKAGYHVDQFVEDSDTATGKKILKAFKQMGIPGTMFNYPIHSEVLGDTAWAGKYESATQGYMETITDFFGEDKGREITEEGIEEGEKYSGLTSIRKGYAPGVIASEQRVKVGRAAALRGDLSVSESEAQPTQTSLFPVEEKPFKYDRTMFKSRRELAKAKEAELAKFAKPVRKPKKFRPGQIAFTKQDRVKRVLKQKAQVKDLVLGGIKAGTYTGAVRFAPMADINDVIKAGKLTVDLHCTPILSKDYDAIPAYGDNTKTPSAMIIPDRYVKPKPEAHTNEALVDKDIPIEEIIFIFPTSEKRAKAVRLPAPKLKYSLETPAFKKWFKKSVVTEEGKPIELYHGTTHEFTEFDPSMAYLENFMGRALYFTDNPADASENYSSLSGPDLTNRINREIDRLSEEISELDAEEIEEHYGVTKEEAADLFEDSTYENPIIKEMARRNVVGPTEGSIMPVYVSMQRPLYLNGPKETEITIEPDWDHYETEAKEDLDRTDYETDEEYEEAVRETAQEFYYEDETPLESGNGVDLKNAFFETADDWGEFNPAEVWSAMRENLNFEPEMSASDLFLNIMDHVHVQEIVDPETGDIANREFMREWIERAGYDGVVLDASKQFPDMFIREQPTTHYMPFKGTQVKSVFNMGTWKPNVADIRYSKAQLEDKGLIGTAFKHPQTSKVYKGKPGQVHIDILNNNFRNDPNDWPNFDDNKDMGYITKAGKFLNRREVADLMGFERAESAESLNLEQWEILKYDLTPEQKKAMDHVGLSETGIPKDTNLLEMNWFEKNVLTKMTDSLYALGKLEKGKTLGDLSGYKSFNMLSNFPGMFSSFLNNGRVKFQDNWMAVIPEKDGGLFSVEQRLGKTADSFFKRLTAKSGREILDRDAATVAAGKKSRFAEGVNLFGTDKTTGKLLNDRQMVRDLFAGTEIEYRANKEVWDWAENRLKELNTSVLDFAEKSNLIDPMARKKFEREYYIPFFRITEDMETGEVDTMFPKTGDPTHIAKLHKLAGSHKNVGDPFNNLVNNYSFVLHESLRNLARGKSLSLAKKMGLLEKTTKAGKQTVGIRVKGRESMYNVLDPELYKALVDIDTITNGWMSEGLGKWLLRKPKLWLTKFVTYDPSFRLANFMRDTLHTSFMQKGFIPVFSSLRGGYYALRQTDKFKEFASTGGAFTGAYHERDTMAKTAEEVKRLKKRIKRAGYKAYNPIRWWDVYRRIGEASENAARMGVYMLQKRKGVSAFEAAYSAKDLLDFHRSGSSGFLSFLTQTVPFLNARIQGMYKLGRTAVDQKTRKNFWVLAAAMSAATTAYFFMGPGDDDRYKELTDADKMMYWHFYDVPGIGHLRIPKPFEIGAFFGSIPEAFMEYVEGQKNGKELGKYVYRIFRDMLRMDMPQSPKVLAQQWANKDYFTGAPIIPSRQAGARAEVQYGEKTSKLARIIGANIAKVTGNSPWASPRRIQKVFEDLFSYGTYTTSYLTDMIIQQTDMYPADPALADGEGFSRLILGTGRFIKGKAVPKYTKSQQQFYEMLKEANAAADTFRIYKRMRDRKKAKAFRKEYRQEIRITKKLSRWQRKISKYNQRIDIILASRKYTAQEKRKRIDALILKRLRVFQKATTWGKEKLSD